MEDKKPKYETLIVNTAVYYTLHTKKYARRKKWQPADPNEIRAFIPATILEVFVTPGQQVTEGENLFRYEAMKMQTVVEMPFAGTIAEIHIAVGDKVRKDQLLILLDPAAE